MMPAFLDLARLFEAAQAEAMVDMSTATARVGDAWLSFAGAGSFVNKAVGLGLGEPVRAEHLDAVDAFFAARGSEPKIELTAFADDALLRALADRGYVLAEVESVLARGLRPGETHCAQAPVDGLRLERVDANDEAAAREYLAVAWSGFLPEGAPLPEEHLAASLAMMRVAGAESFLARVGGEAVGAGGSCTRRGVTSLFGASVKPQFRRRGVQQALIAARLDAGRARGATLAVIVSKPGIPTERNAARLGFAMGYTRFVLVRRAPGLAPSM